MPRTIRFHLDESCDTAIADGLRLRGLDVSTTQEAGLRGAIDERQLEYAHAEKRVLITHDSDFLALHHGGAEHSGILYCHQRRHPLGEVIRRVILVWEVYDDRDFRGRLEYL